MTTAEAFDRAAAAFRDFGAAWAVVIEEFEADHGPRPEGVPFLEWAIAVERKQREARRRA